MFVRKNYRWKAVCCAVLTIAYCSTTVSAEDVFQKLGASLNQSAVDARVDRVWHAIPGLSGWALNIAQSEQTTKMKHDGQTHLVWDKVPPTVSLRTLPPEPIYKGPSSAAEKPVCLMVNVSWGEEYVPAMLKTLASTHVPATFFVDGAWARKHPQLVKQMVFEGQDIGSHGSGHPDFRQLTNAALVKQISETNQTIQAITGRPVDIIAPPSGSYDQRVVKLARQSDMYTILWTTDTVDWKRPPAASIVARVVAGVSPGALVLMHPTAPTKDALPQIIAHLRARGYIFKTVDDMVAERSVAAPPIMLREKR